MMFSYFSQIKSYLVLTLILISGITSGWSQTINYAKSTLNVDVTISDPCDGLTNGFITFKVNNATAGPGAGAGIQVFGPVSQPSAIKVDIGSTFVFNAGHALPDGTYNIIIVDNVGTDVINSFVSDPAVVLTAVPAITLTPTASNNLINSDCALPLEARLDINVGGGSGSLAGGGSFAYTWSSTATLTGMPKSGVVSGMSPVNLNLNTLLGVAGLPGGTYTLVVTDQYSSCSQTIIQTITDPSPQVFTASTSTPSICEGSGGVILLSSSEFGSPAPGVSYEVYKNGVPTGITSAGTGVGLVFNVPAAQLVAPNTYTFQVIASNGFCTPRTMTGSPTIMVKPLPEPTVGGPLSACINTAGNLYTTESGMTAYTWSVTGGTITSGGNNTDNTATVTWTSSGPQSISVNYTNSDGCRASVPTSLGVTVNPLPVPTFTSGPLSACVNLPGNVYVTQADMTGYSWSIVGGTITSGGNNTDNTATVTWTSSGPQSISVSYTDGNGCGASAPTSLGVTVNPLPVPTFTSGPLSACVNLPGNVYVTQAGMTGYSWSIVGGTITSGGNNTDNTATVTWTSSGPQSISVSYTDGNGCGASIPTGLGVTVNPLPVPTFTSGPLSACVNLPGNVYVTQAGMTGYSWSIVGGTITSGGNNTDNTATVTWTSSGPQSISVNYTNSDGCGASAPTSLGVTVNPLPVPTFTSGPLSACVNLPGNVYVTQAGMTGYSWSIVGGTITSGGNNTDNTATVTWTSSGPQSINVNYTNGDGCGASAPTSLGVTVNPLPVPTFTSGPLSACVNLPGNVYVTQAGMTGYSWSIVGGTITSGGNNTDNTATVTWTSSGPQSISVSYTDGNGCGASAPTGLGVTVNPLPVPTFTSGPLSACVNLPGNVYVTQAGMTGYSWSIVGGTITSGGNNTDNTATVTWTSSGPQSISVSYTDGNGCGASAPTSLGVTVNPLPVPTFTSGPLSACINTAGNLYTTESGMTAYTWSVTGGTITSGGSNTDNTATVTWTSSGSRSINVNYTDGNGCTASMPTSYAVIVENPPSISLTIGATIANVCTGGISGITVAASEIGVNYQLRNNADNSLVGSPQPGTGATIILPTDVMTSPMVFNVLADNGTCIPLQLSSTASVNVSGTINAGLSVNPVSSVICSGSAPAIQILNSETGVTYQLRDNFDDGLIGAVVSGNGGTINLPGAAITLATTYNVLADNGSCQIVMTSLATVTIQPDPDSSLAVTALALTLCSGDNTSITISTSESGISYQLRNDSNDSPVGSAVAGNGGDISLSTGSLTASTTFNVLATGVCVSVELANKVTITVAGVVNQNLSVTTPASTICEGTSSVVRVVNSEAGVSYQLRNDSDDSAIGTAVAGTGTTIDLPTGTLLAATTFNVLAITGTCSIELSNKVTITTDVAPNATIAVTPLSTTCYGVDTSVKLASEVGVIYQLRLDADDSFVGAAIIGNGSLAQIHIDSLTSSTTYNILATRASCTIELVTLATINVLPANDPACTTGGGGTGECATVVITAMSSPATCNDSNGTVSFGISPAVPQLNTIGVRITVVGTSTSNLGIAFTNSNDNFFINNVPRGGYDYTIVYGDLSCVKTGQVTVGKIGGVADPVATNIIEPLCFGDPSGSVKIDVAGETGNTLQWSLDATNWKNFVAGDQVTGIPSGAAPAFQQTISVRKNAADLCFGGVSITMKGPLSALDTLSTKRTISQPDLATGSLLVDIIESLEEPYEARLELIQPLFTGQAFAQNWTTITRNTLNLKFEINFVGLYAGTYQLSLRDGLGCEKNYTVIIGVDTEISLPNIFTPNGDGVNEVFYIRNLPTNAQLMITNRWGSEVYSSKDYKNDWDGGSTTDGVYYYRLSASGQSFTGWVEILRGK